MCTSSMERQVHPGLGAAAALQPWPGEFVQFPVGQQGAVGIGQRGTGMARPAGVGTSP